MTMMNDRTSKRRAKSAPSSRAPPTQQYTINNLPETIPENRPVTMSLLQEYFILPTANTNSSEQPASGETVSVILFVILS